MHTSTTSTAALEPWSIEQLQQATQGYWLNDKKPAGQIKRILTDSRDAESGDAFLALKGERFDAHDFIAQVAAQGCEIAIVSCPVDADICQLVVEDTRLALGLLGAYRRQQNSQLKVIALTGSSGKTTTKEMLGSILSRLAPTLVTRGNLNNDLGVPVMLLELRPEHQYAVMELGASHQGEIDYTSKMVQPHVAGIINIGTAHLGEFGGRDGICRAKSEIYAHISEISIIPAADDFAETIRAAVKTEKSLSFGAGGDVYASDVVLDAQSSTFTLNTAQGSKTVQLPFAGEHNVENATAAAAFALAIGVGLDDIVAGLEQAVGAKGRLNFIPHKDYLFIDDTYNANPGSMRAAAEVLAQQQGIRVMVTGDIGELGSSAAIEHYKLGRDLVSVKGINFVVAVGEFAPAAQEGARSTQYGKKMQAFLNQEQALPFLIDLIETHHPQPMSFLFKGSRFTHMETLMAALMEKL
ncbi:MULTISPECIES: UDP-N-acetylmuramoyl-tripeptide--D-alanyl-D-alanine ligase [Acinetobacter]|jgi:UDP-N-acetylmuramoyl-tripeptide--D-alanyl-D-alanine ligase|uniref:UDP-N-acetylmuramoyl-tripeptide--D-alanyl-D- alanine ligase n=1 Tax=Acinetobacter TaxID=469 RepID=UPI0005145595|nr:MULTISPECIES: UDP-N-acetylmuramoyl-tripeptide--D-alanyl-D-alanine ligase [Acinetobacter]KGH51271.1 UDP-N-acetylmuramoyl-tripeptide--D-alanyl-D-alanine ligase [Acinetobacter idrijaensis]NGP42610.1 UDP-N-acetylmuramoyl-tripeptide--D-alanyl-D-alanine ligase [Acinetobacter lwoffii]OIU77848.1 UDP-N-acetylmuramoyl-tripeptide--D-alanyl-D-alanine ligase [Acinetobacter sp. AR2-3]QGR74632.1 UDP-N-acetylmuramoyl-tripeptide--D-alanyl-D-alanine ligase [Acinetobacter lwoffii]QKT99109.1 UDP-N-acetylmuramo